jgi:TatD DNase family protein
VSIGTTVEASRANIELARRFPMVRAAVGVHPHEADGVTDDTLKQIDSLAGDPAVVAIGEVGLDAYRQPALPERQPGVLEGFIDMAARRSLPLLLHCRDAYEPLLELLRRSARAPVRGIIHCASGPPEFILGALDLGLHISFAGNVTFPNAKTLRELVPLVPDDRLLIETDAPFLAPQPVRGKPNEPAHVAHTAAFLARLRGTTPVLLGQLTSRNARRLFNLSML